MNNVTSTIESNLITFATNLYALSNEIDDINQYYFATPATTLISGLSTDNSPATTQVNGALSKGNYIGGLTLIGALQNFFGDADVSTTAYLQYADALINGSYPIESALSQDVENIGGRLKALGQNVIQYTKDANLTIGLYNASGLSAIIGSISASTVIFGCSTSQAKFVSGMVLMEAWANMFDDSEVTTGDYLTTVISWSQGA